MRTMYQRSRLRRWRKPEPELVATIVPCSIMGERVILVCQSPLHDWRYIRGDVAPHYPLPVTDDDAQEMIGIDAINNNPHIANGCRACLETWFDNLGVDY